MGNLFHVGHSLCDFYRNELQFMNLSQFRSLPKDKQALFAKQKGIYLFGRTTKYAFVKLYQVENFYVELYFDKKMAFISIINSFDSTERLQPYLQLLDVSEVEELLFRG